MKVIRCLKNVRIGGKNRRALQDTLSESEWAAISPSVQNALIGSRTVEEFTDENGVWNKLIELEARIDVLEGRKKGGDGAVQAVLDSNQAPDSGTVSADVLKKLRKGVVVAFLTDGVQQVGTVKRVVRAAKTAEVTVGEDEWEVNFADIVEVDATPDEVRDAG
jgi:hypothetical protein